MYPHLPGQDAGAQATGEHTAGLGLRMPGHLLASHLLTGRRRPGRWLQGCGCLLTALPLWASLQGLSVSFAALLGPHFASGHVWGQLFSLAPRTLPSRCGSRMQGECMSSDMWGSSLGQASTAGWAGELGWWYVSLPSFSCCSSSPSSPPHSFSSCLLSCFFSQIPKFPTFSPFYISLSFIMTAVNIHGTLIV